MAARRYEISLRVLKNISRVSAANERNILFNTNVVIYNHWRLLNCHNYRFCNNEDDVNCGRSSQLQLQFKQLQINPKKHFGTSTGFEPMASAYIGSRLI